MREYIQEPSFFYDELFFLYDGKITNKNFRVDCDKPTLFGQLCSSSYNQTQIKKKTMVKSNKKLGALKRCTKFDSKKNQISVNWIVKVCDLMRNETSTLRFKITKVWMDERCVIQNLKKTFAETHPSSTTFPLQLNTVVRIIRITQLDICLG